MIIINIMASDVLSTQGVRSSRDMVPTKFARNIPVSAAEEFNSSEVLKQEKFFFIHPEILQACPQQFRLSNFVRKSTQSCRYQMSRIKIWNTTVCGGTRILCGGNSDSVLLMSWILAMLTHQKAWWFIQCVNRMSLGNETTVHDNISNSRVVSGQF